MQPCAHSVLAGKGRGQPEAGLIPRGSKKQKKDSGGNGDGGEDIYWGAHVYGGCHMDETLVAMGSGPLCPPSPAVNGFL